MQNKIVSYGYYLKIHNPSNELITVANKRGDLYHISSFISENKNRQISANLLKKSDMIMKEKWHRALGHVNFHYLNKLCKDELLTGLPKNLKSEYVKCAIYIESKMANLPFANNRSHAKEILEI